MLVNLADDPAEAHDLAAQMPDKVRDMAKQLRTLRERAQPPVKAGVGAQCFLDTVKHRHEYSRLRCAWAAHDLPQRCLPKADAPLI